MCINELGTFEYELLIIGNVRAFFSFSVQSWLEEKGFSLEYFLIGQNLWGTMERFRMMVICHGVGNLTNCKVNARMAAKNVGWRFCWSLYCFASLDRLHIKRLSCTMMPLAALSESGVLPPCVFVLSPEASTVSRRASGCEQNYARVLYPLLVFFLNMLVIRGPVQDVAAAFSSPEHTGTFHTVHIHTLGHCSPALPSWGGWKGAGAPLAMVPCRFQLPSLRVKSAVK